MTILADNTTIMQTVDVVDMLNYLAMPNKFIVWTVILTTNLSCWLQMSEPIWCRDTGKRGITEERNTGTTE